MNKSKGFTLIELIVVIAIIAILAAIVLVNVTQYINKSKDAAIKSDLASIATGMAACFAGSTTGYSGCYSAASGTTYVPLTLITDITTKSKDGSITEHDSGDVYCVSSQMASSASNVCVDSTGITTVEGAPKCDATFVCK